MSSLSENLSTLKSQIEDGLKDLQSSKELYDFKNLFIEGKKL